MYEREPAVQCTRGSQQFNVGSSEKNRTRFLKTFSNVNIFSVIINSYSKTRKLLFESVVMQNFNLICGFEKVSTAVRLEKLLRQKIYDVPLILVLFATAEKAF
jgi:hypothetical protein